MVAATIVVVLLPTVICASIVTVPEALGPPPNPGEENKVEAKIFRIVGCVVVTEGNPE
jgi:hypothetical protein